MGFHGMQSVTKPISKQLPAVHNHIGAGITGIGAYKIARFLDGMVGNRVSAIGIGLPFVGSLSLLDLVMILSFKASMRKNSYVAAAFAGDRVFNLAQNPSSLIPGIGGLTSNANSVSLSTGSPGGGI